MMSVQIVVYIPLGGQTVVQIDALMPTGDWTQVFSATKRDVDFSTSQRANLGYVTFSVEPCRTSFPTDTLRVTFDTSLTQQWLEVQLVT